MKVYLKKFFVYLKNTKSMVEYYTFLKIVHALGLHLSLFFSDKVYSFFKLFKEVLVFYSVKAPSMMVSTN